jgi:hypothetical protein
MVSARTTLRRLPSACEAAEAGAAGVRVAQPSIAARASTASAVFMNSALSPQAGQRDFDALTRLNPCGHQPAEPPDRQGNRTSLTSLHLDDTTT